MAKKQPAARITVYEVRVKPGHPQKTFYRAGIAFSETEPVRLPVVPDAVRDDPWLIVTAVLVDDV